jgi:hypothetical protein
MRVGRFEQDWNLDGRRIFRLQWDHVDTSVPGAFALDFDTRRLEFARYLFRNGHLSDRTD